MTRFTEERQDCVGNLNDMDSFNDLIWELALSDIPLGERSFTWTNKRDIPMFANPDRYLISEAWDDNFPLSLVKPSQITFLITYSSPYIHPPLSKVFINSTLNP